MQALVSLFTFKGRARRTSYGIFFAVTVAAYVVLSMPFGLWSIQRNPDQLLAQMRVVQQQNPAAMQTVQSMLKIPHGYVTASLIASAVVVAFLYAAWISLSARRLHDMGLTGWLVLLAIVVALVPVAGYLLVSLVLGLWPGTKGANRYGPDPRRPDALPEVFGPGALLPRRSI